IKLNISDNPVAIIPGEMNKQLIHAADATELNSLDVVFPIVHGTLGEDGSLQGMMRLMNLPFVGPDVLSSAVCMDKDVAKRLLNAAGVKVAKGLVYTKAKRGNISYEE